jgi:hypothetical protein
MHSTNGLDSSVWCGIAVLTVGAGALVVYLYVGLAALAVGGVWYARGCYKELHGARR